MSERRRLKVLSFTTLFPNPAQPLHGLFIKNRLERIGQDCNLTVIAPINIAKDPKLLWNCPEWEQLNRISVYHPRFAVIPGLLKHLDGEFLFRQTFFQMRKRFELDQYDLVDVHYAFPDGVAGQRIAQEIRKPFVISLRGSDIHVLAKFPGRRVLIQKMLQKADAIIPVSRLLGSEAVALGANPKKIRVLPNGVDRSVFFPRNKEEARQKLGWPLNASIILSVGRLVELKGFNLLIKAINRVRSGINKSIQCFIVGDGEERPLLEKQIKQNHLENEIKLAGWVSPQDLPFWYSAADLFCLLSHSEGCPNVVLESLACGTPVVATRAGGTYEVVQEEVTGLMIENRSEEEVARQIEKALEMHWNRNIIQMSETVRDWSEVARAQVQLFQQLTDQA